MKNFRILIVEDEILIADNISRYLIKKGHHVIGIAISYKEAVDLYLNENPDIILLDIKLSGSKTGIDFAHFIQNQSVKKPFIFLTSQMDTNNINNAKETFPAGYLSKPIQKDSLYATIEIVMHKQSAQKEDIPTIPLFDGHQNYLVPINEILYLEADHIYLNVHVKGGKQIILRSTLKNLLDQLPVQQFIQTHRSFAINVNQVNKFDPDQIYIKEKAIPISRSRKKLVLSLLQAS